MADEEQSWFGVEETNSGDSKEKPEYIKKTEFRIDFEGNVTGIRTKFGYWRRIGRTGNELKKPKFIWRYGKWRSPTTVVPVKYKPRDKEIQELVKNLIDYAETCRLEYEFGNGDLPLISIFKIKHEFEQVIGVE